MDTDPRIDAALRGLSRTANHGRLWVGLAAALGLTGLRGRQAAGHGLTALAAASLVANLVAKPLAGGARPDPNALPSVRRLHRQPSSGAFPSGHSASAAAFATASSLSWPAVAPLVVPLAGAVAYSRLHTGAHWLSDVLGGLALGTGVGVAVDLTLRILPKRAPEGPGARRGGDVAPRAQAPALPDGEGLTVIANSRSGSAQDAAAEIARALPRARILMPGRDGVAEDLSTVLRQAATDPGTRALGVCGGDGTVSAAAATARAHDLPLAVLPGGTLNHFAKAVGLESVDDAASAVVEGRALAVDVADLTVRADGYPGRGDGSPLTVLNTFALGSYPEMVEVRERHEQRWGKWLAGTAAALAVIRHPTRLELSWEGVPEHRSWLTFAGVNRNLPPGLAPATRLRLDTGTLDVRDYRADAPLAPVRLVGQSVLGRRGAALAEIVPWLRIAPTSPPSDVEFVCRSQPAEGAEQAEAGPGVSLAHDGEILHVPAPLGGLVRIRLAMAPGALVVYAP